MRAFFLNFFLLFFLIPAYTQESLLSPEQFLGYPLGKQYTEHYRVVEYFRKVAESRPEMVRMITYGKTYEGRPLVLGFISSPENINRLEEIRQNNLRLAGVLRDQSTTTGQGPVIVWLSYNVHGNETSSSEAAMKTLYTLVSGTDPRTKEWLKNTVVVMDPCINPDGRDRYVHWFNSVVGEVPDPDPYTREHREPWPGGRTNHYFFDLNRDWAWQSQAESRQRLKVYNEWLPQVHVDYHEQSYNAPYYFAPAAEPYHEVITPWQREFQIMIGKNHAKYFDQNGWLYFTKQEFDLFYPSYGDTYPTYNGAIGMTYEQGGIASGLAVKTEDGDTLRLSDRIEHHFTTGISTIEVASAQAPRLLKEFQKFFSDGAQNGAGVYKTYVIKSNRANNLGTLKTYLDRNGIEYQTTGSKASLKGFHYDTNKEESFSLEPGDLVISTFQPKASLVKVLFEPESKLVDSITYDITAWALPYVMGLDAFAVKEKINPGRSTTETSMPGGYKPVPADKAQAYAYLIPWENLQSARALSQLLKAGIKVRYAEKSFSANGRAFKPGTLIITRAANQHLPSLYNQINQSLSDSLLGSLEVFPVQSGFVEKGYDFGSDRVRFLRKPKVALLMGDGVNSNAAGEIWHFFEQQIGYPVSLIKVKDFRRADWKAIDVLILADGQYPFLQDKSEQEQLKNWIRQGGRLIALENAVVQLSRLDGMITLKKEDDKEKDKDTPDYDLLKRYENREREEVTSSIPGAVYRVFLDNSHPLAFGYPNEYYTLKQDDHLYEYFNEGGWNVGVLKEEKPLSGFVGTKTRSHLKDGLLFGVQGMGRGTLVYLADDLIFRSFWENGKLMMANAIFMVGQ